ncbi:hypothetical protein, partial [Flavobacterium enshiense]
MSDPTICFGGIATIALSSSENGVSYQLRESLTNNDIGTAQIGDGGDLYFTVSPGTTTTYKIVAYHIPTSCAVDQTDESTVTVNPVPNANATNSSQTICSGTAITAMVLSGSVASTTFNW